jgi:hypothetical protein
VWRTHLGEDVEFGLQAIVEFFLLLAQLPALLLAREGAPWPSVHSTHARVSCRVVGRVVRTSEWRAKVIRRSSDTVDEGLCHTCSTRGPKILSCNTTHATPHTPHTTHATPHTPHTTRYTRHE